MVAGLALVLSLASPQSTSPQAAPAPTSAGTAAPAQRVVRPADAPPPIVIEAPSQEAKSEKSAPDPSAEEIEMQIDALRAQNAKQLQREIDALRQQSPEKLQLQTDDSREQRAEKLQLEIDRLRENRPSLAPPAIFLGAGVVLLVVGVVVALQCNDLICALQGQQGKGTGLEIAGAVVGLGGLVWLVLASVVRGNIDREIEALEAQQWRASSGLRVTPWARDGAGGLALSLPVP
jgi:hypothetical protein